MSIFPILVDQEWIISVTVKRPVTRYIISSEYSTLLGLGPCGFPSFWISTSGARFFFSVELITVKHLDEARNCGGLLQQLEK